ncbi:PLP-dependent aminotransferase family protein [Streptomyces sp. NPDC004610]|uniref:MocR-like pyridoxine biosynthesis transcription factor PdxR n=1 Tax=unclassified Streptomyces TaxID=2593676 RepID=UPI0033B8C097
MDLTPLHGQLDRKSGYPLHIQLYRRLREAILDGRLQPGARLPASRALQEQLGVARNTVLNAYTQLFAEGYIEGRQGSGTYVTQVLPDDLMSPERRRPSPGNGSGLVPEAPRLLSRRGQLLAHSPTMPSVEWRRPRPFYPGVPAYDRFPMQIWRRLWNQCLTDPAPDLLGYRTPRGYRDLRAAIAGHLNAVRGVDCDPDRVIVVSGSQQAIDLAVRALLDPDDEVWIENPCYPGARSALLGAGAKVVPVEVDDAGMDVGLGLRLSPHARMAYVTPSHQYPLGSTMSVARRVQLLHWAAENESWIVEDDYDSEFRYSGRLFPALQGLDTVGRVIYIGTYSKVLFPAIRLGYIVVPADLVDGYLAARAILDRHPATLDQAVLAGFIAEGHLPRHIRRMRTLYSARQAALIDAVSRHCGDLISVAPDDTGMHLTGWLAPGLRDIEVAARCAEYGISTPPVSPYYHEGRAPREGLLLGYTGFDTDALKAGVTALAQALRASAADAGLR